MGFIAYCKKCPYLILLLLSGLCVSLSFGAASLRKMTGEAALETGAEVAQTDGEEPRAQAGQTEEAAGDAPANGQTEKQTDGASAGGQTTEVQAQGKPAGDSLEAGQSTEGQEGSVSANGAQAEAAQVENGQNAAGEAERDETLPAEDAPPQEGAKASGDERGQTGFLYYEPVEVSSPYYTDPGRIALSTDYPYETVEDDYFTDAAFIGDSRTLGLYDYSGFSQADFYCDNGFCTYLWKKGKGVDHQNVKQKVLLNDVMSAKTYGKIYIMLGLNDCGYGNIGQFQERYKAMLDMLHEKQPGAVIYLLANLHLSKEKSDADSVYNNVDINAHNVAIAELADGVTYFYLDLNDQFCDENRNLKPERTFDGTHLYAEGYIAWTDSLKRHAVVR